MEYKTLSAIEAGSLLVKDIMANLFSLATQRKKRDAVKVTTDYDRGEWEQKLKDKRWTRCSGIEDYVYCNEPGMRIAKIENRLVHIKTGDYYRFRMQKIQEVLSEYASDSDELVELGCGWGLNMFLLAASGKWKKISGYDISPNALQAAKLAAEHFGLSCLSFGTINLLNPGDPAFGELRGKTVFTHHCLEQLKYSTRIVFENLIKAGVKRVIHFEPTTELLNRWSLKDLENYIFITRMDYQNNLLKNLWRLRSNGRARILVQKRMYFAPGIRHDHTLAIWEPLS